jgi:membrane protease YdiL (CAAX protease family)
MSLVKRHPIITFFVLTYAISWGFLPVEAVRFLAGGPFIAALIGIPLTQGWAGLRKLGSRMIRWRVRWYWYVVAIGLPLAVVLVTAMLNVALGAEAPSLVQFGTVTSVLMVFVVRLVDPGDGALGEEPGWRGFALPGLQSTLSPLVSTLILAVLVTGWHVPIRFAAVHRRGLPPGDGRSNVLVLVVVQPHGRQRAHNARVARHPGDHNDRGVVVRQRGRGTGHLALWSRGKRGCYRVGRLRLEGLARICGYRDDDTPGDAAQRSDPSGTLALSSRD